MSDYNDCNEIVNPVYCIRIFNIFRLAVSNCINYKSLLAEIVSSCYVTSDVGQSKHFCSYPRTSPVLKCGRKNQPSFRVHNQEPGQFLIVDLRTSFQFRSKIQDRRIAASAIPSSQDRKLFPSIGDKQVSGYLHFQFISLNKNVFFLI